MGLLSQQQWHLSCETMIRSLSAWPGNPRLHPRGLARPRRLLNRRAAANRLGRVGSATIGRIHFGSRSSGSRLQGIHTMVVPRTGSPDSVRHGLVKGRLTGGLSPNRDSSGPLLRGPVVLVPRSRSPLPRRPRQNTAACDSFPISGNDVVLLSCFDGIATGAKVLSEMLGTLSLMVSWEIDPACIAVSSFHFPKMVHRGDFLKDNPEDVCALVQQHPRLFS